MKRVIKWEMVVSCLMVVMYVWGIISHIKTNGFYLDLISEIAIDSFLIIMVYYITKELRNLNKKCK